MENIEENQKTGVKIRNEIRVRILQVVLRYDGYLRFRQDRYDLRHREPWVIEFRHLLHSPETQLSCFSSFLLLLLFLNFFFL